MPPPKPQPPKPSATAERTAALINALSVNALSAEDPTPHTVAAVLREHGEADPVELSAHDITEMRAVAEMLREVFAADDVDAAAATLNHLLRLTPGPLRLSSHDGLTIWHPHLDSTDDAPWGEWFLASSCLALTVLLWNRQRPPGGICASSTCWNVYVNQGSGLPRRYCSRRCATRERVATHRRTRA
ncbi:CGNR zinc finger domain-containing protein [Streptomyces sp. MnatMP-M17]|uniref:CGNR zinc finger domain-containing protein n=1 Tax=Streptomyces sp. SID4917 TaxID=2690269 RepID=UPI00081D9B97|nr:CGNR zinc finger domain-containing protein [Streptomyces sp. MnatMP-M17]MYZ36245.1 CGNR zinc finger domain-containing protein [Streptomyces sp. SID4917]SCF82081.1 CGNR zinc finger domain-containing protein [Streptomyces sp. MnatMP-M17]